jgi:hypothetical protein
MQNHCVFMLLPQVIRAKTAGKFAYANNPLPCDRHQTICTSAVRSQRTSLAGRLSESQYAIAVPQATPHCLHSGMNGQYVASYVIWHTQDQTGFC